MGLKSIIDVDINDETFRRFKGLFDQYQAHLAKMPAAWGKVDKEVNNTLNSLSSIMLAQNQLTREAADKERALANSAKVTEHSWGKITTFSGKFAKNILSATKNLLKWTGITTALGGLLGAGGLFGIERLASSVSSGRRTSLGLGTSYGSEKAFMLNYQRVVDPDFLGNVNDALHDQTKRFAFRAAGMRESDLRGDTADVAVRLINRLKQLVDKNPNLTGPGAAQMLQATGLGNFGSVEQMLRIKALSPEELAGLNKSFSANRNDFALSGSTQRAWTELSTQLGRAGQKIESVLVNGLTPLADPIKKLSDSVAQAIGAFLGSKNLVEFMPKLGKGIEDLGSYLGSEKFRQDVQTFATDIGTLAHSLHSVIGWFTTKSPSEAAAEARDNAARAEMRKRNGLDDPNYVPWYKRAWDAIKPGVNNPGNLMYPGLGIRQSFATPEEDIREMSKQLLRDQYTHHQDTLRKLIYGNKEWPGYTSTDRESYLSNLSKGLR
ncbi:MAG: hypothetical protein KGL39_51460, partial [Patescibacteria group bacterium]|nr:hypothetical protein [Patescibacteria group bacterium]